MTTIAETRLAAYIEAEARILKGQEVRFEDRFLRNTDLREVRDQISKLQLQVAREKAAANGGRGLRFSVANLSGEN
jgi:hypothetical protein